MSEKELISVIVSVYKVQAYIEKCVESILCQTYDNIEIILVDDGSPDSCPAICDHIKEIDHRIKVIHKENGGLSDARNRGLSEAAGQYVLFIDGDDYIDKRMVEKLYLAITSNNADMSVCDFEYADVNGVIIESIKKDLPGSVIDQHEYLEGYFGGYSVQFVVAWNKLYRRTLFDGIIYPENKIHEDEFVIHKLIDKCEKIVTIPDKLYYYVQRDNSIMSSENTVGKLDGIEAKLQRVLYFSEVQEKEFAQLLLTQEVYPVSRAFDSLRKGEAKDRVLAVHGLFRKAYAGIDKSAYNEKSRERINACLLSYFPALYNWLVKVIFTLYRKINESAAGKLCKIINYAAKNKSRIRNADYILIDTPVHGNLGDHAIAIAEEQIIKRHIGDRFTEITAHEYGCYKRVFPFLISDKQTLLVHGGGFIGSLWADEELRFRDIIHTFRNNRVIVFPQTVTFELNTEADQVFLEDSRKVYAAHNNMAFCVREKKSYEFMKEHMPDVNAILVPDVVSIMEVEGNVGRKLRDGILLCMRHDKEKKITKEECEHVISLLKEHYPDEKLQYTDTVVDHRVLSDKRKDEVQKKIDQFSSAKLVITDRLHGMLFAAITNTPCIALGNCNDKVKGVYEWICKNEFIRYIDSIDQFEEILLELNIEKEYTYNEQYTYEKMNPLFSELERSIEKL